MRLHVYRSLLSNDMRFSLQRLLVTGFRGVRDTVTLDFTNTPPGLYFVRGENRDDSRLGSNGSGKSTLFSEALIWLLTGAVSQSKRPGDRVENRGWQGKTEVTGEFEIDNQIKKLSRSRNPNGLWLNGERIEQRDVDKFLPLTDAALRKSILIDQFGEMFLSLGPEAKSQIFTETLDLDKWLRAADLAGDQVTSADKELQTNVRKQEGASRALTELRNQLRSASDSEAVFEEDIKARITDARVREKVAKAAVVTARAALDEIRAKNIGGGRIQELNDEKTALRPLHRELAGVLAIVAENDHQHKELECRLAAYSKGGNICPECGQRVDAKHIKEKRAALLGQIEAVTQQKKNSEKVRAELEAQITKLETRIIILEKELTEALAIQTDIAIAAGRSLVADKEVHRILQEIAELEKRPNPFTAQCDALEKRVKELRSELKLLKEAEAKIVEDSEIAKFWVRGFREIRLEQIDAALAELELATNRHAEALGLEEWRVAFATERETQKGTVSHGFSVSLYPPGAKEPVNWDTYSGGESQRWQLATTFGLAEVLLSRAGITTDFEVLDEPSAHLSPEGIDDLLECLADRARETQRRIFLIDHNSLDRGAFDGIISVVKTKSRGTFIEDGGGVLTTTKPKRERVIL